MWPPWTSFTKVTKLDFYFLPICPTLFLPMCPRWDCLIFLPICLRRHLLTPQIFVSHWIPLPPSSSLPHCWSYLSSSYFMPRGRSRRSVEEKCIRHTQGAPSVFNPKNELGGGAVGPSPIYFTMVQKDELFLNLYKISLLDWATWEVSGSSCPYLGGVPPFVFRLETRTRLSSSLSSSSSTGSSSLLFRRIFT